MDNLPGWKVLFIGLLLCVSSPVSYAQTCGEIIYDFGFQDPIEDCDNPLNEFDGGQFSDVAFLYQDAPLANGEVIEVAELPAELSFSVSYAEPSDGSSVFINTYLELYQHEGSDYRLVRFVPGNNAAFTVVEPGTYSLVHTIEDQPQQVYSPWQRIKDWFIPTAYAQFGFGPLERTVVTFTVELAEQEPAGASSVLFLPGIQASRLYTDGVLGTEDRLWEPNNNADVRQLAMSESGESINEVYTRDVVEEVTGLAVGGNVYKSFLGLLEDLEEDEVIHDHLPFAYDWRRSVFDVATQAVVYPDGEEKLLLDEVLRLAEDSYTGKVTIVGHSNGGLVAKALLEEYGNDDLVDKVDKLIMVGTPQLGTPKGVGAMLHGTDQQKVGGLLIDDEVAREVIRNMPGAYSLLPSERYFSDVQTSPMISAQDVLIAQQVREYGEINTRAQLNDFMLDSLDVLEDNPSINQPLTLNEALLTESGSIQAKLDDWLAPSGVEVYEVVGTGLPTIVGFEYQEYGCSTNAACILTSYLKPHPIFLNTGDATVVAGSAQGYEGEKVTAFVDLVNEGEEIFVQEKQHADLTESAAVQTFIDSVIRYPYVTDAIQVPEFSRVRSEYTIVGVHSPVTPSIVTPQGQRIDRDNRDIIGAQYVELGGSVYLIIPNSLQNYTIELSGDGDGVYTLTIEQLSQDNETTSLARITASSSPQLQAAIEVLGGNFGNLFSDNNGDGEFDAEWTLRGELVLVEESVIEQSAKTGGSQSTRVVDRVPAAQVLGAATSTISQSLSIEQHTAVAQALLQIEILLQGSNRYTVDHLSSIQAILMQFKNLLE